MSFRVRFVLGYQTRDHGPADGLLAEIQRNVLKRHPDWARRLHKLEASPFTIVDQKHSHREMRRRVPDAGP